MGTNDQLRRYDGPQWEKIIKKIIFLFLPMQQHNCCYFFLYRTAPLLLYSTTIEPHNKKTYPKKERACCQSPASWRFIFLSPSSRHPSPHPWSFSLPIPFQISLILEVCQPTQRLLRHFSQRYWKLYLGRSQAHSGRPSTFLSVLSRICFVKAFFQVYREKLSRYIRDTYLLVRKHFCTTVYLLSDSFW